MGRPALASDTCQTYIRSVLPDWQATYSEGVDVLSKEQSKAFFQEMVIQLIATLPEPDQSCNVDATDAIKTLRVKATALAGTLKSIEEFVAPQSSHETVALRHPLSLAFRDNLNAFYDALHDARLKADAY